MESTLAIEEKAKNKAEKDLKEISTAYEGVYRENQELKGNFSSSKDKNVRDLQDTVQKLEAENEAENREIKSLRALVNGAGQPPATMSQPSKKPTTTLPKPPPAFVEDSQDKPPPQYGSLADIINEPYDDPDDESFTDLFPLGTPNGEIEVTDTHTSTRKITSRGGVMASPAPRRQPINSPDILARGSPRPAVQGKANIAPNAFVRNATSGFTAPSTTTPSELFEQLAHPPDSTHVNRKPLAYSPKGFKPMGAPSTQATQSTQSQASAPAPRQGLKRSAPASTQSQVPATSPLSRSIHK